MQPVLKYLVISDLDDTLLGNEAALERFHRYFEKLRPQVIIAYATGRSFESVAREIPQSRLPVPVAVIANVGTEIRHFSSRAAVESWTRNLAGTWSAAEVRRALDPEPDLELQPKSAQSNHKVSYYVKDASAARLTELEDKLLCAGLHADCIYSSAQDLDIVPKGMNKGSAAACLARELGFDNTRLIVAGNSGNDHSLLRIGCPAILVANANPDLTQQAGDLPHVYHSTQSYADGVREGLDYWLKQPEHHPVAS
jgi:sucrose-6F-phosphate phosphohydrolase